MWSAYYNLGIHKFKQKMLIILQKSDVTCSGNYLEHIHIHLKKNFCHITAYCSVIVLVIVKKIITFVNLFDKTVVTYCG